MIWLCFFGLFFKIEVVGLLFSSWINLSYYKALSYCYASHTQILQEQIFSDQLLIDFVWINSTEADINLPLILFTCCMLMNFALLIGFELITLEE